MLRAPVIEYGRFKVKTIEFKISNGTHHSNHNLKALHFLHLLCMCLCGHTT